MEMWKKRRVCGRRLTKGEAEGEAEAEAEAVRKFKMAQSSLLIEYY